MQMDGYRLKAFRVNHNVLCYGYTIEIDRAGSFDATRAKKQGIPLKLWNPLQKGETMELEGRIYTPDMVLGPAEKGHQADLLLPIPVPRSPSWKMRPARIFLSVRACTESPEKEAKAVEYKHMTFKEAAGLRRMPR